MADSLLLDGGPGFILAQRARSLTAGSPNRLVLWFILSIPVVWALGVAPVAACFFAALFFRYRSRARTPEIALLAVGVALLVSMVIAATKGAPSDRLLAAGYNLIVLLCACCALNFGRKVDLTFARSGNRRMQAVAFFFFYAASIGIAFVIGSQWPEAEISFPALVTSMFGEDLPGLLGSYATARLSGADWDSGSVVPRPLAFGVYFNEGALMFLLCGVVALLASRAKPVTWAISFCLAAGLITLGSRMLLIASILASTVALVARTPASKEVRILIASVGLVVAILAIALNPNKVDLVVDQVVAAREESSAARFLSYSVAVDETWRQSPVVGLGIKPRDDSLLRIPIGSHSTVVSTFTKGGILALFPLLIFYAYVVIAAFRLLFMDHGAGTYRKAQVALGATALIILAWMLVQDFDAPIYGSMLAFTVLGSALGLLDRLRAYERIRRTGHLPTAYPKVQFG